MWRNHSKAECCVENLTFFNVKIHNIVVVIEESQDLATLNKDKFQSSLEAHEQRMDERGNNKENAEIALQARFNEKSKVSKEKRASKGSKVFRILVELTHKIRR